MNIEKLKEIIENKTIDNKPLVLVYKDTGRVVCEQYIDEICKIRNLNKKYNKINWDSPSNSFGMIDLLGLVETSKDLFIFYLDELVNNDIVKPNHIICCHKVNKLIMNTIKDNVVEIPEVETWQLQAYASGVLKGLSQDRLSWFVNNCKNPIRFMLEIDRLRLFADNLQNDIFDEIVNDGFFDDFIENSVFDLTNAIQKRDKNKVSEIIKNLESYNINPMGLTTLLYNSFKDIAAIKLSPNALPQTLNIAPKKFNALKYYVNYYSKEELINILGLLSSIDYRVKSGELPVTILFDYLLTNILL